MACQYASTRASACGDLLDTGRPAVGPSAARVLMTAVAAAVADNSERSCDYHATSPEQSGYQVAISASVQHRHSCATISRHSFERYLSRQRAPPNSALLPEANLTQAMST